MGYVTVLKTQCDYIDINKFVSWVDTKNKKWWNKYGLTAQMEDPINNDEIVVRSLIDSVIEEFNHTGAINTGCDVGCLMSLGNMVMEYLKENHVAKDDIFEEISGSTHLFLVRK